MDLKEWTLTRILNEIPEYSYAELHNLGLYDINKIHSTDSRIYEIRKIKGDINTRKFDEYNRLNKLIYDYRLWDLESNFIGHFIKLFNKDIFTYSKLILDKPEYKIIESYCEKNKTFISDIINEINKVDEKINGKELIELLKIPSLNINNVINICIKQNCSIKFMIKNHYIINKLLKKNYSLNLIIESITEVDNEE